jgi:hypothetical protein
MIAALIVIFLLLIVFEYCNLRTILEIKEQTENLNIELCQTVESFEEVKTRLKNAEKRIVDLGKVVDEISLELGSEEPKRLKNESYLEDGFANLMAYDPHRK